MPEAARTSFPRHQHNREGFVHCGTPQVRPASHSPKSYITSYPNPDGLVRLVRCRRRVQRQFGPTHLQQVLLGLFRNQQQRRFTVARESRLDQFIALMGSAARLRRLSDITRRRSSIQCRARPTGREGALAAAPVSAGPVAARCRTRARSQPERRCESKADRAARDPLLWLQPVCLRVRVRTAKRLWQLRNSRRVGL